MAKIILEDLKFNKKKRAPTVSQKSSTKEEPVLSYKKEKKEESKPKVVKEKIVDKKEEEKIEQYLNKMHRRGNMGSFPALKEEKAPVRKGLLYPFLIILILSIIYFGGKIFENTTVHIVQREESLNLENKELVFSSVEGNGLPFEIMITSLSDKYKINLTEKEDVSIKSKGEIILYNEFSTTPQKLQSGSFVIDQDGKTYKIDASVSIPGYKLVDGNKIPGEISVPISAFLAGEGYNGSPTDFYINLFKGTDKYYKIYGKLKSPLVGGIAGEAYKLNSIDKDNIRIFANSSLRNNLFKKVKAEIPPGYIFYEKATNFSYEILGGDYFKENKGDVVVSAEMKIILMKEEDLKNKLVNIFSKDIKDKEIKNIEIPNIKDLNFSFKDPLLSIDKNLADVSFLLDGEAKLLWHPDTIFLKSKLAGTNKEEVDSIFSLDPGVSHASIKIFPPWNKYLPKDISKINIIID